MILYEIKNTKLKILFFVLYGLLCRVLNVFFHFFHNFQWWIVTYHVDECVDWCLLMSIFFFIQFPFDDLTSVNIWTMNEWVNEKNSKLFFYKFFSVYYIVHLSLFIYSLIFYIHNIIFICCIYDVNMKNWIFIVHQLIWKNTEKINQYSCIQCWFILSYSCFIYLLLFDLYLKIFYHNFIRH